MRHPRPLLLKLLVLLLALLWAQTSRAEPPPAPLVTVIHIDAMPQFTPDAVRLLAQFRLDSLQEPGALHFQLLQEIDHPNHFTLVETWATPAAYQAHTIAPRTRRLRDRLQPMLGSPFDERTHIELPGSS